MDALSYQTRKRVAIIGGTGFVGSGIAIHFLQKPRSEIEKVYVCSRNAQRKAHSGSVAFGTSRQPELYDLDCCDKAQVVKFLTETKVDWVVLAVGPDQSSRFTDRTMLNSVIRPTEVLISALEDTWCRSMDPTLRALSVSSSASSSLTISTMAFSRGHAEQVRIVREFSAKYVGKITVGLVKPSQVTGVAGCRLTENFGGFLIRLWNGEVPCLGPAPKNKLTGYVSLRTVAEIHESVLRGRGAPGQAFTAVDKVMTVEEFGSVCAAAAGKAEPFQVTQAYVFVWVILTISFLVAHLRKWLGMEGPSPVTPDVLDFYYEDWDLDTHQTRSTLGSECLNRNRPSEDVRELFIRAREAGLVKQ